MEYNSKFLQICGVLGIDVTYAHDNRELSDCRVRKHQFPKLHKFGDIEECITWNPTPQNTVLFTLWVNSVSVMNKIT